MKVSIMLFIVLKLLLINIGKKYKPDIYSTL